MRIVGLLLLAFTGFAYAALDSSLLHAALPAEGTMEEFRPVIETISKGVAKVLASRRQDQITVGTISGPPTMGTASGAGFRQMFTEELQREGIRVAKLGTEIGLSGEYRLTKPDSDSGPPQLQFEVKLVDSSGQILTDLASTTDIQSLSVDNNNDRSGTVLVNTYSSPEAVALALGLTADMDVFFAQHRDDSFSPTRLQEILNQSKPHIGRSGELRSSSSSPYGLQLLVNGQPRALKVEDGRIFASLAKNETFALQFINNSNLTVAAFFTLDGINSFAFSDIKEDGRPKYSKWLVSPNSSFPLKGWHKNNDSVLQFKVTDFSDSAAALVGADGQLGMLSVVVRATWPANSPPPAGEPMLPGSAAGDLGIGFGDRVDQSVREDSLARDYGRVRSIMTIHYVRPD